MTNFIHMCMIIIMCTCNDYFRLNLGTKMRKPNTQRSQLTGIRIYIPVWMSGRKTRERKSRQSWNHN